MSWSDLSNGMSKFLAQYASKFSVVWLPVEPEGDNNRVVDTGKVLIEDLLFAPCKIYTLARVFNAKSKHAPGWITWVYTRGVTLLVSLLLLWPFYFIQGTLWQAWRLVKNLWLSVTGRLTFMDKKDVFPE